jgi:hypothetical protein
VNATLHLVGIAAGLVFIGLMVAALVITRGDVPLRNFTRAVHLYGWATGAQAVVLAVHLATADWLWLAVSTATLAMAVRCVYVTRQRRDLKADRVQAEAGRTVRDYWRGGTW